MCMKGCSAIGSRQTGILRLCLLAAALYPHSGEAQEPVYPVCSGFFPQTGLWHAAYNEQNEVLCPPNSAFLSVVTNSGPARAPENVSVVGSCCELPAGALASEFTWETVHCPQNSLATGSRYAMGSETWERRAFAIRCTALAPGFQLGLSLKGSRYYVMPSDFYSVSLSSLDSHTTRSSLPVSLRNGLGRSGRYSWSHTGCVGERFPSVLTGKTGSSCEDLEFRELQWRGPNGWQPVAAQRCVALDRPFSIAPGCIAEKE